jgi:hypothetical protein
VTAHVWIEGTLTVIELLWWGAFGGLGVEAVQLLRAAKRVNGVPWKAPGGPPLGVLLLSIGLRLFIGCGLATAAGLSGQVSGPMGALAVGICAPLIIDQIGQGVPIAGAPPAVAPAEEGATGAHQ